MGCTKSQLLALLSKVKRDVEACRTVECAISVLEKYRNIIEEHAMSEVWREILSP